MSDRPNDIGYYLLFLANRLSERLQGFEIMLEYCAEHDGRVVIAVPSIDRPAYARAAEESSLSSERCVFVDDAGLARDELIGALESAGEQGARPGLRRRSMALTLCYYVDLSEMLADSGSGARASELVAQLGHLQHKTESVMVCTAEPGSIPNGVDRTFCDLHHHWATGPENLAQYFRHSSSSGALTALRLVGPESRLVYLGAVRDNTAVVTPIEDAYRRGFLILDPDLTIRHASAQIRELLGRPASALAEHPLSICLDGVDLTTVRRECERVQRGTSSSPFITSWRLGGGHYEPREITVDLLRNHGRTDGYLLSIGLSEGVRGPRTVYRDAREDLSISDFVDEDDEIQLDGKIDGQESSQITRREHEVLLLILQGKSNKEIARHLTIAEVTVKKHLTSIYRKLRITNRKELLQSFSTPQPGIGRKE